MFILEKKLKKLYQNILQYLSKGFKNFLIEHKHNFLLFRSLSKVIQTGFFSSIEKISLSFIVLVPNS